METETRYQRIAREQRERQAARAARMAAARRKRRQSSDGPAYMHNSGPAFPRDPDGYDRDNLGASRFTSCERSCYGSPRIMRASYRFGVQWIALNDDNGSPDAFNQSVVQSYVSTLLLADLFSKEPEKVAADIVRYRQKHPIEES